MNKYANLIVRYGFLTMLYIKEVLLKKEMYEELQEMENGFLYLENNLGLQPYPRDISGSLMQDLGQEFLKMNLNGNNGVNNYIYYIPECLKRLNLQHLENNFLHLYF